MEDSKNDYDLRIISLGAGVQSTTVYLMAVRGELEPLPDLAIFADTQAEPPNVYEHLEQLEKQYGEIIPIRRVTAGSLERNLYSGGEGRKGFAQIPAFLRNSDGTRGMSRRQCTYQYKIRPIQKAIREELGLRIGERAAGRYNVEQWIGISTDEAHRSRMSDVSWLHFYYPLLFEKPMNRYKCLRYMELRGDPIPSKSSCYFCPYHSNAEWRWLRDTHPEVWERACRLDEDLRGRGMRASEGLKMEQYLHSSLVPLREVPLDDDGRQLELWGNECTGLCGV